LFRRRGGGGPRKPSRSLDTGGWVGSPWFVSELPGGRGVFFGMESWGARGYQLDAWLLDPKTGKATRLFENAGAASYLPTGQVVSGMEVARAWPGLRCGTWEPVSRC